MTIAIEQIIEIIPDWQQQKAVFQPVHGGLSNINYQVDVNGQKFFVRIPGARMDLLAVDREREYRNTLAASESGVAPRIFHYLREQEVIITEFIHGEPMTIQKLQAAGMPARVANSIKLLHAGPRFLNKFNVFRLMDHYLRVVAENEIELPNGFKDRLPVIREIEHVLDQYPMEILPCHNDLIPENFIDDGTLLRIVDFEYSGNNDPCFELGNAAQELEYDEEMTIELCTAYFGELRSSWLARVQLFALTSHMVWTVWGAIQNKYSKIEFDFWHYVQDHWNSALKILESTALSIWLDEAQHEN